MKINNHVKVRVSSMSGYIEAIRTETRSGNRYPVVVYYVRIDGTGQLFDFLHGEIIKTGKPDF